MSTQFQTGEDTLQYWARIAAGVTVQTTLDGQEGANWRQKDIFRAQSFDANVTNLFDANGATTENVTGTSINPVVRIPGGYCG